MFVPCPDCGYLVALLVSQHGPAQRCPRCHGPLLIEAGLASAATGAVVEGSADAAVPVVAAISDADAVALEAEAEAEAEQASQSLASIAPSPASAAEPHAPSETIAPAIATATTAASTETPSTRAPQPAQRAASMSPTRRARATPSFVRRRASRSASPRHRRWPYVLGIAALAALLALQLSLAQRQELAASARWRPWIAGLCGALQCDLPAWHEAAAFTMLDRNVKPRPGARGVLAVSASFRNDAQWPQPWPTLLLTLSDVDGRPVGHRAFAPAEYRHDAGHDAGAGAGELAPGQSVSVRLDVVEPAPRIVAFTFDFR